MTTPTTKPPTTADLMRLLGVEPRAHTPKAIPTTRRVTTLTGDWRVLTHHWSDVLAANNPNSFR